MTSHAFSTWLSRAASAWRTSRAFAAALVLIAMLPAHAAAQVKPIDEVHADIAGFWRAFLGRELTRDELDRQTRYLLGLFGSDRCEYACMRQLAINMVDAEVFRARPGQPDELALRDNYIAGAFSRPKEEAEIAQRLVSEPDPVRVFDADTIRLMTEKDVVALVNLQSFARSGRSPVHRPLSPEEVDQAAALLDLSVGSGPKAKKMPVMFVFASGFWAGLQREWPSLNAEERRAVKGYIQQLSAKPLSAALYRRLFGIDKAEAQRIRGLEETEGAVAAMWEELLPQMGAVLNAQKDWAVIQELNRAVTK